MKSPRTCGTCAAWQANDGHVVKDGSPQQGWCKAKPPVVFQIMTAMPGSAIRNPTAAPQIVPAYQAAFPPVDSANWCCEWRPKPRLDRTFDLPQAAFGPATTDLST